MTDGSGTTTWDYDDLGRPLTITTTAFGAVAYTYDEVGNRKTLTYPDGKVVAYDYDTLYRLDEVTDWDAQRTTYDYDAAGRLTGAEFPDKVSSSYGYNAADRLVDLSHSLGGKELLASYSYEYDPVGNRTEALEIVSQAAGGFSMSTNSYTYDPLYRLTDAQYNLGQFTFSYTYKYDEVGNRREMTRCEPGPCRLTTYGYDDANRLILVGETPLSWDDNGNLLQDHTGRVYTYDAANRLTSVTGGGGAFTFAYNGLGDRVRQTVDGVPTNYTLDLAAALTQVLADGSNIYLYGLGRIGEQQPGGWAYHLPDALGSVRQLTSAGGAVVNATSYRPFGEVLSSAGGDTSVFGFAGEQRDPTGLVFMRARYYDPSSGRFTSKDPFPGLLSNPSSLHAYVYVGNNPVRYADPQGLHIQALVQGSRVFSRGGQNKCADLEEPYCLVRPDDCISFNVGNTQFLINLNAFLNPMFWILGPPKTLLVGTSLTVSGGGILLALFLTSPAEAASGIGVPAALAFGVFYGFPATMGGALLLRAGYIELKEVVYENITVIRE